MEPVSLDTLVTILVAAISASRLAEWAISKTIEKFSGKNRSSSPPPALPAPSVQTGRQLENTVFDLGEQIQLLVRNQDGCRKCHEELGRANDEIRRIREELKRAQSDLLIRADKSSELVTDTRVLMHELKGLLKAHASSFDALVDELKRRP